MACAYTASDGRLTPKSIVKKAKENGLEEIAITDHDAIEGIAEAIKEGKKIGVKIIPGVELTCYENWGKKRVEIHIKGLDIDFKNKKLREVLKKAKLARINRAKLSIEKLRKLGYEISWKRVRALSKGAVGRPHVAAALMENEKNKDKLKRDFKLDREPIMHDIFSNLLSKGKSAYVEKMSISPKEAIKLIHRAGGLADLSHPGGEKTLTPNIGISKIREYKKYGLDAVEVYYAYHTEEQIRHFAKIAKKLDLVATGGTDYHGETTRSSEKYQNKKNELGKGFGNLEKYWKK